MSFAAPRLLTFCFPFSDQLKAKKETYINAQIRNLGHVIDPEGYTGKDPPSSDATQAATTPPKAAIPTFYPAASLATPTFYPAAASIPCCTVGKAVAQLRPSAEALGASKRT